MGLSVFYGDVGSYRFGRLCHDRYVVPPLVSRSTNKRDEEDVSAISEGLSLETENSCSERGLKEASQEFDKRSNMLLQSIQFLNCPCLPY